MTLKVTFRGQGLIFSKMNGCIFLVGLYYNFFYPLGQNRTNAQLWATRWVYSTLWPTKKKKFKPKSSGGGMGGRKGAGRGGERGDYFYWGIKYLSVKYIFFVQETTFFTYNTIRIYYMHLMRTIYNLVY